MARKTQAQKDLDAARQLQGVLDQLGPNVRRVLALDLSLNAPGFALVDADGRQHTEHLKHRPSTPINDRLRLTAAKALYLATLAPGTDVIVVEQAFATSDSGTKVLLAHGAVRSMLSAGGWRGPIVEIHNSRLWSFALPGVVRANQGKAPIIAVARERFGLDSFDDNQADALVLAALFWSLLCVHFGDRLVRRPQWEIPERCMTTVVKMATGKAPRAATKRKKAA